MGLVDIDGLCRFVGGTGAGFAVGLDLAGQGQGALGQGRAYQLVDQDAEQNHVADLAAVGQGGGGHGHAQCHTGLGQQGNA